MGLFWDLIQQSQISEQHDHTASLEQRVQYLEHAIYQTPKLSDSTQIYILPIVSKRLLGRLCVWCSALIILCVNSSIG